MRTENLAKSRVTVSGLPANLLPPGGDVEFTRPHIPNAGAPPRPKRAPDSANPGTSDAGPSRRRLLVVDDEDGPRQALQIIFQGEYEVMAASGGREALEMLADRGADAAILDIRMAGMNGIELLQRVKELDPDMEIIMLTAYASMETARQAIRLGAFDYLNKPFEVKTLRQAVTAAMARRSLSQEVRHNEERLATLQSELQNQQLLQEIARTRGEIYASVIHDMKQPLTVISGYIQLAMSGLDEASQNGTSDLSEVKSLLRLMTRQVTNCVDISQRYLSFLRRQPLGGSTVQAAQIFADLTDLIRGHPSVRGQTLRISPLPVDMALKTNGTDVLQILLNLIINACQCSPLPHHVDVRGEALHNPLDLDSIASSPGEYVLNREGFKNGPPFFAILVEDDGPGIPPELLGKIFEAYFTTKSSSQGTGLGLAIVLRLVREAGGLIVVRSTLGKGTTFKIVLPAANLPSNRNE